MNELQTSKINYLLVSSKEDLVPYFDRLIDGCQSMLRKTGEHGQTCELLIRQILSWVGSDRCYLLLGVGDDGKLYGFIFALLVYDFTPWIEVQALWTEPGIATMVKEEGIIFNLMCQWARSQGANKIVASITRSPNVFFKFFYEPLGFKKVGYIVEANVNAI